MCLAGRNYLRIISNMNSNWHLRYYAPSYFLRFPVSGQALPPMPPTLAPTLPPSPLPLTLAPPLPAVLPMPPTQEQGVTKGKD